MKVSIVEPCPANWEHMQIKLHARHCDQCDKSVIDFTQKNRAEIITYLIENPNGSVCGRMNQQQFDIKEEDLPELISILSQPRFRANAFLILAVVCSSLFYSCETDSNGVKTIEKPKIERQTIDPVDKQKNNSVENTRSNDSVKKTKKQHLIRPAELMGEVSIIPEPEPPISGGITYGPLPELEVATNPEEVLSYAEVMPEFPGGMPEMIKFLQENMIYPEEMKENGIEGRIYVQFVVTKTGSIEEVTIAKGMNGLNREAIRLVKQMPNWKPGTNYGKQVNVKMVIPILFSLK
ncbi:MAG: energy transducer TonB [Flavobacteriia bacterium]|nr:energy transducer TonB [Flavobacteriia bacterium]NBV67677.1 energy transducer TonB [Flavobacteriia bacterium]